MTDQQTLNLQENTNGILECGDRTAGYYPIYLPRLSSLSEKIVQEAHKKTLHGGPTLTKAEVRTKYWIPNLRQLAKRVIRHCYGCKKYANKDSFRKTELFVKEHLKSPAPISLDPFTIKQRKAKKTRVKSFCSPAV